MEETMTIRPVTQATDHFRLLPVFAGWLAREHLDDAIQVLVASLRQRGVEAPVNNSDFNVAEMRKAAAAQMEFFLNCLATNDLQPVLKITRERWIQLFTDAETGELVLPENFNQIHNARKDTFVHFVPLYTQDLSLAMALVKELDDFINLFIYEGIALKNEYDNRKLNSTLQLLEYQEKQLLEAQEIALVGSFEWNLDTHDLVMTPQAYRIFELEGKSRMEPFIEMVHPEDRQKVTDAIADSLNSGNYAVLYRYYAPSGMKWINSLGKVSPGNGGKTRILSGTVQDVTKQYVILEDLKASEERFNRAEAIAKVGSWNYNFETGAQTWSREMYRIYERDPATPIPPPGGMDAYHHPDDIHILNEARKAIAEGADYFENVYRIRFPDGRIKSILSKRHTIKDANGKVTEAQGTIQDVSEQQELIASLQESKELFKQAQSLGKIGSFTHDVISGTTVWSDEMYRIYGASPHDKTVTVDQLRSYTLERYRQIIDGHIIRCIENGVDYQFQYEIQLPGGPVKTLRAKGAAERGPDGKVNRIIGTAQDVTEYVMIEQRLRENRRFNEKIANATPAIITVFNVNTGQYRFVSNMIEQLLGYTADEATEKGYAFMASRCHPDDAEKVMAENIAAITAANDLTGNYEDDKIIEFRYRMEHKDGHYVWLQTYAIIFDRNPEGFIEHVLNVSIDVSNIVDVEEQLQRNNLLLQQSNTSLEEFAYIASHDLQEPLRKVATFGNMLQSVQTDQLDPKARLYLDKIVHSASRMQSMINDLLAVSLISRENQFAITDLQHLLKEVLQTLEYKIESTGTIVEVPVPLPAAHVIDSQFRQLFQNLLSNSIKFAREDVPCVISITWEQLPASAGPDYGLQEHTGGFLKFDFSDNGIGFDNQYAQRIFAIFQRLHGKSEFEGSGIGLAICRKITEHHHGRISAKGKRDKGATFTVVLPQ